MPEEDTTLTATYSETGYGENTSDFLEYSLYYNESTGLYARVSDVFQTKDDNFGSHPATPTTTPYTVVIPNEITVTVYDQRGETTANRRYGANYCGKDSYGMPIAISSTSTSNKPDAVLADLVGQTVTIPVKGLDTKASAAFANANTCLLYTSPSPRDS